jgi:hypothetical protein
MQVRICAPGDTRGGFMHARAWIILTHNLKWLPTVVSYSYFEGLVT